MVKQLNETERWLKDKGLKNTKQREALIKILSEAEMPLGAEDILKQMKIMLTACNLSTVYRNMDQLLQRDLIVETRIGLKAYYALNHHQHGHYMQCVSCKQMVRIDDCPFESFEKKLEQQMGCKLLGHRVELFGICKRCNENEQ